MYIIVYRSPSYPIESFRTILLDILLNLSFEDNPYIVLVGDFNICRRANCDTLETQLKEKGIDSRLDQEEFTRFESGTQIDWLFSNLSPQGPNAHAVMTFETVFSDHDGIFSSHLVS